nr:SlyX family protein [Thioalkalivibrio sp.]
MNLPEGESAMELGRRIEELEIRIAHQEYALQGQSEELLHLQQANTRLTRQLLELSERVQALATQPASDPADEPPPPHY